MTKSGSQATKTLSAGTDTAIYSFSPSHPPRMRSMPGETVVFETLDCFGGRIGSPDDRPPASGWDGVNPATGPLYVEGARPGDALCVEILDISVAGPGVMTALPGVGDFGDLITEPTTIIVPVKQGLAHLPQGIVTEIRPMIGVIGVAPAEGAVPCSTPGPHGGNMDTNVIAKGSTVYLPVSVGGALLAMGDLHALMGDGEVLGCGVEIGGSVRCKVTLLPGLGLETPVVETDSAFHIIWSAETLDEAARGAVRRSVALIHRMTGYKAVDALALLSACGNLRISQIVDPLMTARMEVPKTILKCKGLTSKQPLPPSQQPWETFRQPRVPPDDRSPNC